MWALLQGPDQFVEISPQCLSFVIIIIDNYDGAHLKISTQDDIYDNAHLKR